MDKSKAIERNVAIELMRVTEAAAMAAAPWMGRNQKNLSDQASVDAMRETLNSVDMDGVVVIGEGEKDEAPMLYIGEAIGNGNPPLVDIAVDPIDGTRLLARGLPGAISVVALSERGTMLQVPHEMVYMNKIAVGPAGKGVIDISSSPAENLKALSRRMAVPVSELTVAALDRPRNEDLMESVRSVGARLKLLSDGDVAGAIASALRGESGVDMYVGIGGSPEAIIAACAIKSLGGDMQCTFWPREEAEAVAAREAGFEDGRVFTIDELVSGDDILFAATGITGGELLQGVRYFPDGVRTHSLVIRSRSGTVRWVEAHHDAGKQRQYAIE
ncbi:MAG TPA: class II fructose-bisphosphatase [Dehalococcoidia bacterium]|nr:class II fructose-bisphosphatase [Dehalococcoidia bacterium]